MIELSRSMHESWVWGWVLCGAFWCGDACASSLVNFAVVCVFFFTDHLAWGVGTKIQRGIGNFSLHILVRRIMMRSTLFLLKRIIGSITASYVVCIITGSRCYNHSIVCKHHNTRCTSFLHFFSFLNGLIYTEYFFKRKKIGVLQLHMNCLVRLWLILKCAWQDVCNSTVW